MIQLTLKDWGKEIFLCKETNEILRNDPETGNLEVLTDNSSPLKIDEYGLPIAPHFQRELWIAKYKTIDEPIYDEDGEIENYKFLGYEEI
jgi:hypothetical protein